MEELFELGDVLGETSESEGIESTLEQIDSQAQKSMNSVRNLMIGIVGIAVCAFLISIVLKKMNKSKK